MVGRTGKRRPKVDRFKTKVILFFMLGVDEH